MKLTSKVQNEIQKLTRKLNMTKSQKDKREIRERIEMILRNRHDRQD